MKSRTMRRIAAVALVLALSSGTIIPAYADGGTAMSAQDVAADPIGSVTIGDGSFVSLDGVSVGDSEDGKLAFLTLTFHNESAADLSFLDYWVRATGSGGEQLTVKTMPQDKDKSRIPAHSSLTMHFYAPVSAGTKLSDLIVKLIKWDFSAAGYERLLGSVSVPDTYEAVTPAGAGRDVSVSGTTLRLAAGGVTLGRSGDKQTAFVTLAVTNAGARSIALPGYSYALVTADGLAYPLSAVNAAEIDLGPRVKNELQLSGTLADSVSLDGAKLVVTLPEPTLKASVPVAALALPSATANGSTVTPVNDRRTIQLKQSGTSIETTVRLASLQENADSFFATVVFAIENTGFKSASVPNYSYAIQTADGYTYALDASAAKDVVVPPRVTKEVQLTATVPIKQSLQGWKLVVTQQAASGSGASQPAVPVAAYDLPPFAKDTNAGSSSKRAITVPGGSVNVGIRRASVSKNDSESLINIFFTFENTGNKPISVPNYSFSLKTKEGYDYPVTAGGLNNLTLNPHESKDVQLSVNVPLTVSVEDMQLSMVERPGSGGAGGGDAANFGYPVAVFAVPQADAGVVSLGTEYALNASQGGSYTATLNAIQRLPWDDQDVVAAELTIGNKGSSSLTIPNFKGYFLLDGTIRVDAQLKQLDNAIAIPAGSNIHTMLYAKVPYTTSFTDIKLVLQQQESGETTATTLAEFKHNADLMAVPTAPQGEPYRIASVGKLSELTAAPIRTYAGTNDDLVYTELRLRNLEKRLAAASKLVGYFKSDDGTYYPVTITNVSSKINPGGEAVMAVWGTLPKGVRTDSLELLIGEAVFAAGGAGGAGSAQPDAYIRAVQMELPGETKQTASLDALTISPYKLSIGNIKSQPGGVANGFTYAFDYTLTKDTALAPELPADSKHRLVLVLTDSQGHKYEQAIEIEAPNGLALGTSTYSFSKTDLDPLFYSKISQAQEYTLTVYDEFKGYRHALATQNYKWYNLGS